jgi:Fe-S oxidoreductase
VNDFENLCPGCEACKEVCPFLAEYGPPDRILRECPEVSFYCTSCRRCDGVCPKALSPSAAFFEEKKRLVRTDRIPPPVHKALQGARRFAKAGHGFPFSFYPRADTVFWPGCGLAASRPGVVLRVQSILSRRLGRPVGLVLDCCFDPVYGLGDTETAFTALREIGRRLCDHGVRRVITGCLNCHKLLLEQLIDIDVVFMLEVLPPEIFEQRTMESIYLHHPCLSSRWESIRNRAGALVRHIHPLRGTDLKSVPLAEISLPVPDLPASEVAAGLCCGNGGGLSALDAALADRFLDRITKAAAGKTIVTYCTGCQNRLIKRGVKAVHLLERLPGVTPRRKIPSPFRQWTGRFALAMAERLNPLRGLPKIDSAAGGGDQKSSRGKRP